MNEINFKLRSDIKIGRGTLSNFKSITASLDISNPLILCDKNICSSSYFKEIKPELDLCVNDGIFYMLELKGEPSYELLSELIQKIDISKIDGVISIGGGSTIDVGKGIAILATNPCEPKKLKGFPTGLNAPLKHITVPSILGSGSEASFNAVFVDESEGRKLGINSVNNFPSLVLVDPDITMSAPINAVISSALDCMVHCVDSFGSKKATPVSKMFSLEGFRNIWKFLTEENFNDASARMLLAQASIHGIYGLMNAGDGPTNGFAYYFGVKNKIPHGMAGGMFLKDVMTWNYENGYLDYEELLEKTSTNNMNQFFDTYSNILEKYSIPTLEHYGYKQNQCSDLSIEVSSALTGSFSGNPINFNEESAEWVLNKQFN